MTDWRNLRLAVREATKLGCEFRVVGADVEIDGTLPHDIVRAALRDYLGADSDDNAALDFADCLGVASILVQTREEAIAAVGEMGDPEFVGLDIETWPRDARPPPVRINADGSVAVRQDEDKSKAGLDPHQADIATLQLYPGRDRSFVFVGEALRLMLQSRWLRRQHLIAHNANFELAFLRHYSHSASVEVEKPRAAHPVECTLQAGGLVHGTGRATVSGWHGRSLADIAWFELGLEVPKELQTSCWGAPRLSAGQLAYASSDAILAHRLWPRLQGAMRAKGCLKAYELQRNAIPAVADMELRGLGIDLAEHARQVDRWSRELAEARREYLKLTGNPVPAKPADVREWVAAVAGVWLAGWPRTDGGDLSIERKHLKRLALSDIPTVKPVLAMLAKQKLLSTFGPKLAGFVNPVTGRIHCSYNIGASKAGRFTASSPNLQQLPNAKDPEFKRCFTAKPGKVLVCCDWSQIEMRAAAWKSHDRAMTAVFAEARDLHCETAAMIARVPADQVTKAQRQAAKPVNFGSIYGIGPVTLAEDAFDNYGIEMTETDAKAALDRFFQVYSGFNDWRWDHWHRVKVSNRVVIDGGRVVEGAWEFGGRIRFTQACNLPIQGIAANCMLQAIAMAFKRLRGLRGGLVACVHDELVGEFDEADAETAKGVLQETMIEAFEITFPGAPLHGVAKACVGASWLDAKD
jgi:DNA polymerase I